MLLLIERIQLVIPYVDDWLDFFARSSDENAVLAQAFEEHRDNYAIEYNI